MFGNVFTACWIGYYVTIVFYCYMQKGLVVVVVLPTPHKENSVLQ